MGRSRAEVEPPLPETPPAPAPAPPARPEDLEPGSQRQYSLEDFELIRVIGRGSYAKVNLSGVIRYVTDCLGGAVVSGSIPGHTQCLNDLQMWFWVWLFSIYNIICVHLFIQLAIFTHVVIYMEVIIMSYFFLILCLFFFSCIYFIPILVSLLTNILKSQYLYRYISNCLLK